MTLNKFIWFIFLCLFIILSTLAICENKCFGAETVDSKYIELGKHNNDYDIGILEFEGRKYLIFSSAKDMGMSPIIDENKLAKKVADEIIRQLQEVNSKKQNWSDKLSWPE